MKVVLFCGGLGTRLKAYSDTIPKPMVSIGSRPMIWHLMKYYAHYGHTEFILCLGYRGDVIKEYFSNGEVGPDESWRITFLDTGLTACVGQRLKAVESHVGNDEVFLANYTDALSDLHLPGYLEYFASQDTIAAFACVRPHHTFHVVDLDDAGLVRDVRHVGSSGLRINGGFFAFKRSVFEHIRDGEDLVEEPFQRLIARGQLSAYRHDGFWHCMDTFKDKQAFDEMSARDERPWEVWRRRRAE
jgi:glucose-1-phosphate cytidylyltransferase